MTLQIHWEVKVGGTGMKEVRGALFAGNSPPFLGRERAAVDVDVGPERRSPRYRCDVYMMFYRRRNCASFLVLLWRESKQP